MKNRLPPPHKRRGYIQTAIIFFGLGIFASFFLSAYILAALEAILLVISGSLLPRGE